MLNHCPQLEKLSPNVRKFWEDKQRELQDTLLQFSYAIVTDPSKSLSIQKGGLLYLMKKNLWFEDFPKSSLFSFIMQSTSEYNKTILQMPLEGLDHFEAMPLLAFEKVFLRKKSRPHFLQNIFRLFSMKPTYLLVSGKDAFGKNFQYAFSELDNPESWVTTLSELKSGT